MIAVLAYKSLNHRKRVDLLSADVVDAAKQLSAVAGDLFPVRRYRFIDINYFC
jgi:hypothetical protein